MTCIICLSDAAAHDICAQFCCFLGRIQLKRESSTGTASASSQSSLEGDYETGASGPNNILTATTSTSDQVKKNTTANNQNQYTFFFIFVHLFSYQFIISLCRGSHRSLVFRILVLFIIARMELHLNRFKFVFSQYVAYFVVCYLVIRTFLCNDILLRLIEFMFDYAIVATQNRPSLSTSFVCIRRKRL